MPGTTTENEPAKPALEQILDTLLSPQNVPETRLQFSLEAHSLPDVFDQVSVFRTTHGSRIGDLALEATRIDLSPIDPNSRHGAPESSLNDQNETPVEDDESFIIEQRDKAGVTLYKGPIAQAENSLLYKASTLLAEAIYRTTHNHNNITLQNKIRNKKWETLVNKLREIEPPDPFGRCDLGSPDFIEYRLDDDDKTGIMCLTFKRSVDEITVKLAVVINPESGNWPIFIARELGFMGGGALPMVRNAILCLIAALREDQHQRSPGDAEA